MRVVLFEDEPLAAERLQDLLLKIDPNIEIVACMDSVEEGIAFLSKKEKIDLIISDIQLADGLSFEIYQSLQISCPIIFATAFDQYAIKAFKLNSIDYLLKPIDKSALAKALDKFKKQNESNNIVHLTTDQLQSIIQQSQKQYKSRFIIKSGDKLQSISTEKIYAFYAEDKYTILHSTDSKKHLVNYKLEALENVLDPKIFFRINRKYMLHIQTIQSVVQYSNSRLKINNSDLQKDDLIVSREKVKIFKEWLDQ